MPGLFIDVLDFAIMAADEEAGAGAGAGASADLVSATFPVPAAFPAPIAFLVSPTFLFSVLSTFGPAVPTKVVVPVFTARFELYAAIFVTI